MISVGGVAHPVEEPPLDAVPDTAAALMAARVQTEYWLDRFEYGAERCSGAEGRVHRRFAARAGARRKAIDARLRALAALVT
jgi:hypothetical protein